MKRPPRTRAPRVEQVELPDEVVAELLLAAESYLERPADEDQTRTVVQFSGCQPLMLEALESPTMLRIFPELKQPGQPESALQYLRRVVKKARRARTRKMNFATNW